MIHYTTIYFINVNGEVIGRKTFDCSHYKAVHELWKLVPGTVNISICHQTDDYPCECDYCIDGYDNTDVPRNVEL